MCRRARCTPWRWRGCLARAARLGSTESRHRTASARFRRQQRRHRPPQSTHAAVRSLTSSMMGTVPGTVTMIYRFIGVWQQESGKGPRLANGAAKLRTSRQSLTSAPQNCRVRQSSTLYLYFHLVGAVVPTSAMATSPNLLGAFSGYTQTQTAHLSFTKPGVTDVDAWRTAARAEAKRCCLRGAAPR